MRLAAKNPEDKRKPADLGRFGLGLKTASFSQCKQLTVVCRRNGKISARRWNLDFLAQKNEWVLIKPDQVEIEKYHYYEELTTNSKSTLVVWEQIDRLQMGDYIHEIAKLKKHLALVFHRFLERSFKPIKIYLNDDLIKPFNPFNPKHNATQQIHQEKIIINDSEANVEPFILPHHSKMSQTEYEYYATDEGYTRSQGFYLYRADRLLIYGTWWGLVKTTDAYRLVRIKIDIANDQDKYWGIDLKKSTAKPNAQIKPQLTRIVQNIIEKGTKPFTGRGKKIEDKSICRFWSIVPEGQTIRFALNIEHPMYVRLHEELMDKELLDGYLKGIQAYLPLDAIQAQLHNNPKSIIQESILNEDEIAVIAIKMLEQGCTKEFIDKLLKTEMFKNRKELISHD